MARPHVRPVVAAATCALVLAGCSVPDLSAMNFRIDTRLHFQSPADRAQVRLPVTVHWTMRGFEVESRGSQPASRNAGYFAVFVDRQPIRPGQSMKAVAKDDPFCANTPGCPDTDYLAERQIYTTTGTSLRLAFINPLPGHPGDAQLHRVVVILMDTAGRRIGESSWELDLRTRAVSA